MTIEAAWGMGAIIVLILGLLVLGNDIALVVKRSKTLERRLERELSATGQGLGEKAHSVKDKLLSETFEYLLEINDKRNKIVHEEGYDRLLFERRKFIQLCNRVESELNALRPARLAQNSRYGLGCLILMIAVAFITYALSLNSM